LTFFSWKVYTPEQIDKRSISFWQCRHCGTFWDDPQTKKNGYQNLAAHVKSNHTDYLQLMTEAKLMINADYLQK